MKLTTWMTTSSPMANQKSGRFHWVLSPQMSTSCDEATRAPKVMSVPKSTRSGTCLKQPLYMKAPSALAAVPNMPM